MLSIYNTTKQAKNPITGLWLLTKLFIFLVSCLGISWCHEIWHTIKPGTLEHKHPQNAGRTPEHSQNTGKTIGIPRNSETWEEQQNNGTTEQHQEILPIQNNEY